MSENIPHIDVTPHVTQGTSLQEASDALALRSWYEHACRTYCVLLQAGGSVCLDVLVVCSFLVMSFIFRALSNVFGRLANATALSPPPTVETVTPTAQLQLQPPGPQPLDALYVLGRCYLFCEVL